MSTQDFRIKEESVIVLLKNLNKDEGLVNGTRLMHNYFIVCEGLTGKNVYQL